MPFPTIVGDRPEDSTLATVPIAAIVDYFEPVSRLPAMNEAHLLRVGGSMMAKAPPKANKPSRSSSPRERDEERFGANP